MRATGLSIPDSPTSALQAVLLVLASAWSIHSLLQILPDRSTSVEGGAGVQTTRSEEPSTTTHDAARSDFSGWRFFGSQGAAIPETPVEAIAAETPLDLKLEGVVAAGSGDRAVAIIEYQGTQRAYAVGDAIEGTTASVARVLPDRVILDNGERRETLPLYRDAYPARAQSGSGARRERTERPATAPASGPPQAAAGPDIHADVLGSTPSERLHNLNRAMTLSAARDASNRLLGYEAKPASDAVLFTRLGLRSGDVITRVNGIDAASIRSLLEARRAIDSAAVAEVHLLREGRVLSLRIHLGAT